MFDLKREVESWTEKAYAGPCGAKAATLAELQDHLYCEVERLEAEGVSQEEAFGIATATLGAEAGSTGAKGDDQTQRLARAHVANAILWSVLIIASALVLSKSGAKNSASLLLFLVYIPLWYASDLLAARFVSSSADR